MALFVGLWFVAVSAGPELTHACPTHGAHAASPSLAAGHAGHGAPAQQSVGAAHHAPGTESAPQRGAQCTCLGQCCSTPPVAFVSAAIALADAVTVATRDAGLPDYAYVPVAARHVLPLAHAPPLSA
jgi:hypothetical protein